MKGNFQLCLGEEACAPKDFSPGCEPGLDYSVTETSQADKVTPYSNTASFLGVLAPSHRAYTTDIVGSEGYNSGDYDISFGGTSAACPYAAGAVACLQSAAKALTGNYLTPAQVKSRLIATGDNVTDTRVDITKPRINVGHAIETLGIQSATFTIFNDGTAELSVTSMTLDAPAPWISLSPQPPLIVGPGASQAIPVSVDPTQAPLGQTTRQLFVASSDPDESPYPGGVFITVNKPDTRPSLNIARTGNKVVVSWTTNASGFILECATNLSAAVWTTVTNQPVAMNGENFVTNNISGQAKFFRLKD